MPRRVISLTSDFGHSDPFVGTMKGVALNINREIDFVDISHSVNAFDLLDGALTIAQAYAYFPTDSIHVVVVDPGVGSERRPIIARTEKHFFIAPDNGVLSIVYERAERLSVRHITSSHYFLQPVSQTFHGRDVFAPCAAWLSKNVRVEDFGDEITDFVRFALPKPKVNGNSVAGRVLKTDRFGNLITNITPQDVPTLMGVDPMRFSASCGKGQVTRICQSYSQGQPNESFLILGSAGYLEIAANKTSASRLIGADRGAEVNIQIG